MKRYKSIIKEADAMEILNDNIMIKFPTVGDFDMFKVLMNKNKLSQSWFINPELDFNLNYDINPKRGQTPDAVVVGKNVFEVFVAKEDLEQIMNVLRQAPVKFAVI